MREWIKKYSDVLFGAVMILLVIFGILLLLSMQDTEGGRPKDPEPTATPTPTPSDIIFVDGLPTAVMNSPTSVSVTSTPASTPTSTIAPTLTEMPTERISTPKPTNSPTPTRKPTEKPSRASSGYSEGKEGTYKAEVNGAHAWKPYARYTAIKNTSSRQYRLQQIAKTDEVGRRYVTDGSGIRRYCVALGTAWAGGLPSDIGRCVDLVMVNGATLHCVLGDIKKVEHSKGGEGRYGSNNELVEFQVDMDKLPTKVRNSGDCSYFGSDFEGEVKAVIVYDRWINGFGKE